MVVTHHILFSLQFPGDEELLAPMGVGDDGTTVACGMESPAGRVLKSIKPVVKNGNVEQVEMKFPRWFVLHLPRC